MTPIRLDYDYRVPENDEKSAKKAGGDHSCSASENVTIMPDQKNKMDNHESVIIGRYPADPSGGGSLVITKTKSRVICRLEYSREFMLQCSLSPWTKLSPAQMPLIVHNFPDLLPRSLGTDMQMAEHGKAYKNAPDSALPIL
uniref:Uncharacterized protein n=1 Tax=Romanomermis culicivorax TaxID=13658 RepID=A0A915K221_ROMCU